MKTLNDYRGDGIAEIELNGVVPFNMRVAVEDQHIVVFGTCRDDRDTVVQERATCQDLNEGTAKISEMVQRVRQKIEASGPVTARCQGAFDLTSDRTRR